MNIFNVVDRTKYIHKGSWKDPKQDIEYNFYYYFVRPMTLSLQSKHGKEIISPSALIAIYGNHPFVKGDVLKLHDGSQLQIETIIIEYHEGNVRVRQHLLPRIKEMMVELV